MPKPIFYPAENVTARVLAWPVFQQCKSVSCYMSMPTAELDTSSLALSILRSGMSLFQSGRDQTRTDRLILGKTLFVPKIDQRSLSSSPRMDFLKVYGEDDLASLPSGVWGIKEPGYHWQGRPRLNGELRILSLVLQIGLLIVFP